MKAKMIIFNDKEYLLRYGFKAFVKIEQIFDKPLKELDLENLPTGDIPKLLWAGLFTEKTLKEVEDMIEESDLSISEITNIMASAISLGMTGKEPEGETQGKNE